MEEAEKIEPDDSRSGLEQQRESTAALSGPGGDLRFDINFVESSGGFEIRYSDRLARDYQELVDQSADWLEDQLGVVNLGQIDFNLLIADGLLSDEVKSGLTAWWEARVADEVGVALDRSMPGEPLVNQQSGRTSVAGTRNGCRALTIGPPWHSTRSDWFPTQGYACQAADRRPTQEARRRPWVS
jgi:hypothetical protein